MEIGQQLFVLSQDLSANVGSDEGILVRPV